jgi:hypothetical protein
VITRRLARVLDVAVGRSATGNHAWWLAGLCPEQAGIFSSGERHAAKMIRSPDRSAIRYDA